MVLGYSRMLYVEYTEDEKVETLIGCHERAMTYYGGITRTCLYDNMKTVVIGQDEQGEVIWKERFTQFATHHGFILRRCKPYRPRTKGKVGNGVRRGSFCFRLAFMNKFLLNYFYGLWICQSTARLHMLNPQKELNHLLDGELFL
jgi:transposase